MNEWPRSSERIQFLNPDDAAQQLFFDLSATGVCCLHDKEKADKSEVLVAVNDQKVRATVVYCQKRTDGFRIGLKFIETTPDKKAALQKIVDGFSKGVGVKCRIVES
ncbi:MAG: PilZ domain-containing protein [Chitinivibrionales bacterium]|nr:PilZ domain-containing protein [Chitinivibrionales bacterium]